MPREDRLPVRAWGGIPLLSLPRRIAPGAHSRALTELWPCVSWHIVSARSGQVMECPGYCPLAYHRYIYSVRPLRHRRPATTTHSL